MARGTGSLGFIGPQLADTLSTCQRRLADSKPISGQCTDWCTLGPDVNDFHDCFERAGRPERSALASMSFHAFTDLAQRHDRAPAQACRTRLPSGPRNDAPT